MIWRDEVDVGVMAGLTLISVNGMEKRSQLISFKTSCGRTFYMDHLQDCCESVEVEDVSGDPDDLIGSPLIISEERSNMPEPSEEEAPDVYRDESYTWTFYEFATAKGSVTLRWFGSSNGCYSESVRFYEIPKVGDE